MGELPESPMILLSYVNTELRDQDKDLESFCARHGVSAEIIEDKLASIDYLRRIC